MICTLSGRLARNARLKVALRLDPDVHDGAKVRSMTTEKPESQRRRRIHTQPVLRVAAASAQVSDLVDLGAVVARNVRAERARRNWRQEDLAERLGWTRGSIGHLESGRRRPSVADLPQLCRVFDISLAALMVGAAPDDVTALRL